MRTTFAFGLALAVLLALRSPARADGDVGVIVTGEASVQPQLSAQIADWLSRHGHTLVASPLPPDALTQLIDCVVISDRSCARQVVEKRARSPRMVLAQLDSKNLDGGARDITLTAYWFDKGHDAVTERKTCQRCTAQALRVTADEVMRKLVGSSDGHVKLKSNPAGARIVIDGQPIGVTPLDWDLPQGKHTIAMDRRGFAAASREIEVVADRTDALALDLTPVAAPAGAPWTRIAPIAMVVAGGTAVVAGGVMVAIDQDTGPNEPPVIRNTGPAGVALMIGGAVVGGAGAFLLFRSSGTSAPVAAIGHDGAYVGWVGRF